MILGITPLPFGNSMEYSFPLITFELSNEICLIRDYFELERGLNRSGCCKPSLLELGCTSPVHIQDFIGNLPVDIPCQAVIAPSGIVTLGVQADFSVLWGSKIKVRFAHLPVETKVQISFRSSNSDMDIILQHKCFRFLCIGWKL